MESSGGAAEAGSLNSSANWSQELSNSRNRSSVPVQRNEAMAKVEVTVLSVILFLALTGNLCVLLALRTTRHKHSRMFFFMKHLSIADLVVAVFQVLPQLLWDITFHFYGPDFLCRLVKYLQVVGMFASTYLLLLMSLDRCLAICQPLRSLRRQSDHLSVLCTWLVCLVVSVPQIQIFSLREVSEGVYDCWAEFIQPWGPKAYITWITLTVYIIPVLVLSACYGLISFKIWQNLKLKTAQEPRATGPLASSVTCAADASHGAALSRVSSVKLISKAKIRTIKMTFIIVLAFIVCWTPFFFVQMWSVWDPDAPKETSLFIIAMLLASLNSCCNPWIYMLFTGHLFHDLVHRFLCCSTSYLKTNPGGETSASKKSNSSTFVLSRKSSSLKSFTQTAGE